jgi:hypothetical protein
MDPIDDSDDTATECSDPFASEEVPTDLPAAPANDDVDIPKKKRKGRGTSYSKDEDLLVCKSFISTSESSLNGTSQKGKVFRESIYECYLTMLSKLDHQTGKTHDQRSPKAVYNRWLTIAKHCTKILNVKRHTPPRSGQNDDDYENLIIDHCKHRYSFNAKEYIDCFKYLSKQVKWNSYEIANKKEDSVKISRPMGKKAAKIHQKDLQTVETILEEKGLLQKQGVVVSVGDQTDISPISDSGASITNIGGTNIAGTVVGTSDSTALKMTEKMHMYLEYVAIEGMKDEEKKEKLMDEYRLKYFGI